MMSPASETLWADASERPTAFAWYGAVDRAELQRWILQRGLDVPSDLLSLWLTFGGGVMFETEEILAPGSGPEYAADFDQVNGAHRGRGLSDGLFLFHEGTWLSAVRRISPRYLLVDRESYAATGEFESLDDWYRRTVREEFAARYGLRQLA